MKTGPATNSCTESAAGWHGGGALKDGSGSHQMAFIYIKPSRRRNNTSGLNATRSNTSRKNRHPRASQPAAWLIDEYSGTHRFNYRCSPEALLAPGYVPLIVAGVDRHQHTKRDDPHLCSCFYWTKRAQTCPHHIWNISGKSLQT